MDQDTDPTHETQAPAEPQVPAPPAPPTEPASAKDPSRVVTLPTKALSKRLDAARKQGREQAAADLEAKAKSLGFKSMADMEKAAQRSRTLRSAAPVNQPPTAPAPAQTPEVPHDGSRSSKRLVRENERLLAKVREHNRARAAEERRRKAAEERNEALEAEMVLRTSAVKAGVQDVDYSLELLRRRLSTTTAEELKGFNETKFFSEDLRKSHPYLFSVREEPAQTGPTDGPRGAPAPKKQQVAPPTPPNGKDPRSVSREEYLKKLHGLGLNDPQQGF